MWLFGYVIHSTCLYEIYKFFNSYQMVHIEDSVT